MTHLKGWRPKRRNDGKGERSNTERAASGEAAMRGYLQQKGFPQHDYELQDNLTDLVTDLFHYAALHGLDLNTDIATAQNHFEVER